MRSHRIVLVAVVGVGMFSLYACGDSTGAGGQGAGGGAGGGVELTCGDGFPDPDLGEECDDGNFDDFDGCLSDCTLSKCGDGVVQEGVEECDDGNSDDTDGCVSGCVFASCGDGFIQTGVEDCDDGNEEDGDACSSTCTAGAGCGNGNVDDGEECDDGNTNASDDCVDCVLAFCGDGHAQLGVEECDDGNTVDDDACSNACFVNVPTSYGCPGIPSDVGPSPGVTLGGNTADATDLYIGSCGGDAPEIVHAFTATVSGVMNVEMLAIDNALDPVLYAKADCEGDATIACADATFEGGDETLSFPVTAGTTYYVFADGYGGSAGEYLLAASVDTTVAGDNCPGTPVTLTDFNDTVTKTGDTSLANADRNGTGACNSPSTKDIVYKVVPPMSGKLVAALDPSYDGSLYIRTLCTTTSSQIGCSESAGSGGLELLQVDVTAGANYFVIVDGKSGSSGAYSIDFTLLPP